MTLTIELPDEKSEQLSALARQRSITLEELVAASAIALVSETEDARRERLADSTRRILEKKRGALQAVGMTDFLRVDEVIELHRQVILTSGGLNGVRDVGEAIRRVNQDESMTSLFD